MVMRGKKGWEGIGNDFGYDNDNDYRMGNREIGHRSWLHAVFAVLGAVVLGYK